MGTTRAEYKPLDALLRGQRLPSGSSVWRDANNIVHYRSPSRFSSNAPISGTLSPGQLETVLQNNEWARGMLGDDSVPTVQDKVNSTVSDFLGAGDVNGGGGAGGGDMPDGIRHAQTANLYNLLFGNRDKKTGVSQPPNDQILNLLRNRTDLPSPIPITREVPDGMSQQVQSNFGRKLDFMTNPTGMGADPTASQPPTQSSLTTASDAGPATPTDGGSGKGAVPPPPEGDPNSPNRYVPNIAGGWFDTYTNQPIDNPPATPTDGGSGKSNTPSHTDMIKQSQQQMPSGPRHPRDNRMAGDLASTGVAPARDAKPGPFGGRGPVQSTDGGTGKSSSGGGTFGPVGTASSLPGGGSVIGDYTPAMGPMPSVGTGASPNVISGPLQLRPQGATPGLPDINDRYGKARRLDREPGFTPVEHGGFF
jgi:hypothetical protein